MQLFLIRLKIDFYECRLQQYSSCQTPGSIEESPEAACGVKKKPQRVAALR